jgi:hypothetical protein
MSRHFVFNQTEMDRQTFNVITRLLSVSPRLTDEINMNHLHHSADLHISQTDKEMVQTA